MLRLGIGAGLILTLLGGLFWFAHDMGYQSHVNEIETAIREINDGIDNLAANDAVEHAAETAADANATANLNKHASTMQSCALDQETASVLNTQGVSP